MAGDLVNVNPMAMNSAIEFLTAMVTPTLADLGDRLARAFDIDTLRPRGGSCARA